jgi:hypothetical protein
MIINFSLFEQVSYQKTRNSELNSKNLDLLAKSQELSNNIEGKDEEIADLKDKNFTLYNVSGAAIDFNEFITEKTVELEEVLIAVTSESEFLINHLSNTCVFASTAEQSIATIYYNSWVDTVNQNKDKYQRIVNEVTNY